MKIIVQNIATEYMIQGPENAPVVLMLHGWMDSLHSFDAISAELSTQFRVVRVDMPGFGLTEAPDSAWTMNDYVLWVAAFITKLGVADTRLHAIIGHSFGGRVILKGVGEQRLYADNIILIAAAGNARRNTLRALFLGIAAKIAKGILSIPPLNIWRDTVRKKMYARIGSDYANAGTLADTFVNVINEDLSDNARKITTPTLLIWGAEDSSTPLGDGLRLAELIPDSQMQVVKNAGHFVHQEAAEYVTQLIKKFL